LDEGAAAMFARSHVDLHNIRMSIERIGNVSDNIIHVGPLKLGLDGILTWVPGVGGLLIIQGIRARVSASTLMSIATLVAMRTFMGSLSAVPGANVVGDVAADLFTAHKWSADMLVKAMDETIYFEGTPKSLANDPEHIDLMAKVKSGKEKRRVVYLH
jgi:hypothetical protein